MGHNTAVLILNDALDQIENDPDFGKNLAQAIRRTSSSAERIDVRAGNHCNAATVLATQHADFAQIFVVGGNCGFKLGDFWMCEDWRENSTQMEIIRRLAEKHGYTLRKKPKTEG